MTAFNDNALVTYLATIAPGLSDSAPAGGRAGAVTGGGLTVIANAPNPAGQALLRQYGGTRCRRRSWRCGRPFRRRWRRWSSELCDWRPRSGSARVCGVSSQRDRTNAGDHLVDRGFVAELHAKASARVERVERRVV